MKCAEGKCRYSRSVNQEYPRRCLVCKEPEDVTVTKVFGKKLSLAKVRAMLSHDKEFMTYRVQGIGDARKLVPGKWSKETILASVKKYGAEVTGPEVRTRLGCELCFKDEYGYLFIKNTEPKV